MSGWAWLEELETLCRDRTIMWDRDYWLPLPTDNLQSTVAALAGYEESVAFAKAVYMDLKVPIWEESMEIRTEGHEHTSRQ